MRFHQKKISKANVYNMSITIPTGTRIYLTKEKCGPRALFIKPDTTLINDDLVLAHDVKVGTVTALYKGTRVRGNWVTESLPVIAAQLQTTKIFLNIYGQDFFADSAPIQTVTVINPAEVDGVNTVIENAEYKSPSNIIRRIVTVKGKTFALQDDLNDFDVTTGTYLNINTREIPVTLRSDLVISIA